MSKIIPRDQAGRFRRWTPPDVDGAAPERPTFITSTARAQRSDVELLAAREQAQREGFREGYEEGLQAAQSELTTLRESLRRTLAFLARPAEYLEAQIEEELLALALAVARQILRREIQTDPRHLIGLIRHAVRQLPATQTTIHIHLHPDDARVVRPVLHEDEAHAQWDIVDDPAVARGDCEVTTDSSHIDAGIDALVARLSAELLGGQRRADRPAPEAEASPTGAATPGAADD